MVREWREELEDQVAVGGVHLNGVEAGGIRALGGCSEGGDHLVDLGLGGLAWGDQARERDRGRADGFPTALAKGNRPRFARFEVSIDGRLASSVLQLDGHLRALAVAEVDDSLPCGRLFVVP